MVDWKATWSRLFACGAAFLLLMLAALPAPAQRGIPGMEDTSAIPSGRPSPLQGPYALPPDAQMDPSFREGVRIITGDPIRTTDDVGYAQGRTRVEYETFALEADKMVIDYISGDIRAEGNVVFSGPDEFITADAGYFNIVENEGVAFGVDGQVQDMFFRVNWNEDAEGPSFVQMDEQESIFRGMLFTTSNFPVPFYYIASSEVILLQNERVYFRNPVLYVRNQPVFWLPFYSRSLGEGSPWWVEIGYASRISSYIRIGYRYIHRLRVPSVEDPGDFESAHHGLADSYVDLMSRRGIGVGTQYRYQFDFRRHTGYLELYGLRDDYRDVEGEDSTPERWIYRHKHNSLLNDSLMFQWYADTASDPDVHADILDRFTTANEFRRGRMFERHLRGALTYISEDAVARIMAEQKERLARDRYTDFTSPFDDDLDFDPDPNFTDDREIDEVGINRNRYATVTERVIGTYATRLLNLGSLPLYYRFEANAFDALDAGYNQFDPSDDTRVRGVDAYGALTHRLRLGERTTWTNTVGAGGMLTDRQDDEIVSNEDFLAATPNSEGIRFIDSLRLRDQETVILGGGPREVSTEDINDAYAFVDYRSRLNHRFSNYLEGFVQYRIRHGAEESLGDYYESVGRIEAESDIYNFYTNEHWVEGQLNYFLRYPSVMVILMGGYNLQDTDSIYANEPQSYAGLMTSYTNDTRELEISTGIIFEETQIRDYEDPQQYTQGTLSPYLRLAYFPYHGRYWANLDISTSIKTEEDPVERDARQRLRFDENADEVIVRPTIGRQFGPKYRVQLTGTYNSRYETWENAGVVILRDLHDAELGLLLGVNNNNFEERRDDDNITEEDELEEDYELEARASLRFKIARDQPGLGARSITTLSDLRREGYYVE